MIKFGHVDRFVLQSVGHRPALAGSRFRVLIWPLLIGLTAGLAAALVSFWGVLPAALLAGGVAFYLALRGVADREVVKKQQLLEKYTDSLPGMLYQCRLYPNFHCVITYANSALEWIYEKDLAEMQKDCRSIFDLVHPDDKERIWKSLGESAVHLTPWKDEYRVILPRQGLRWRYAQAQVERLVDGSTLWHGFVTDITWRKENDERLRQAEAKEAEALRVSRDAAQKLAEDKARFLAEMSHEIRTPLGSILGFAHLLKTTALAPDQLDFVVTMERSADLLLAMVNDTLDLAKIEAGHFQIRHEPFALRGCIESAFKMLRSHALPKGLQYTCRIAEAVPEIFRGDRLRVEQVLLNLVGNAIKYTERGRVGLSVEAEGQERIRIVVEDTGPGLSDAEQEKIFSPYYQGESRQRGSTGLGLAITRNLCEMMGGTLTVQSEPGKGSRFVAEIGGRAARNSEL